MTTIGGSVVEQARFLPFGEKRPWSGAPSSAPWLDRGFTGHLHNDEVGLIYMNARYYVPGIGRFASADTIVPNAADPQAFNRFSYVYNNPLDYTDPTGHDGSWCNDQYEGGVCGKNGGSVFLPAHLIPPLLNQRDNISGDYSQMEYTSCGETSLAMNLQSLGSDVSPSEIIEYAIGNGWYLPNDPNHVYTSPENLIYIAEHYGREVESGNATSLKEGYEILRTLLAAGVPVIIDITTDPSNALQDSAHFVSVWGVDEDGTVYYNDPLGERSGVYRGATRRYISSEQLASAWENNSDANLNPSGAWFFLAVAPKQ